MNEPTRNTYPTAYVLQNEDRDRVLVPGQVNTSDELFLNAGLV
jgi:hypothetical protein